MVSPRDRERDLCAIGVDGKLSPDEADDGRLEHSRTIRCAAVEVFVREEEDLLPLDLENFSSIVSRGLDDRRDIDWRRRSF